MNRKPRAARATDVEAKIGCHRVRVRIAGNSAEPNGAIARRGTISGRVSKQSFQRCMTNYAFLFLRIWQTQTRFWPIRERAVSPRKLRGNLPRRMRGKAPRQTMGKDAQSAKTPVACAIQQAQKPRVGRLTGGRRPFEAAVVASGCTFRDVFVVSQSCKQAFLHPALLRASSTSCAGIAGIIFGQAWQSALHCTRSLTTSSTLADRIAGDALSSCVGGITIPRTYSIWPLC